MQDTTTSSIINDKKVINGWAFFDWANSSYALVITVAIFPAYFLSVTDDTISILGTEISNSALYAYTISMAYILIALISPLLSSIADFSNRKKAFMRFFTYLGSVACISLFFFKGMGELVLGTVSFLLATIGFAGGLVFYNAYLPLIASEDQYDRVSAKGFAYGFIGSVILLIFNLIVIMQPNWFGIQDDNLAVRVAFVSVGLWWLGFAQIPFKRLPADSKSPMPSGIISKSIDALKVIIKNVQSQTDIKRFLLAFFCYSAGTQTILFLASTFAEKELAFETTEMITLILILQILAIVGAYLFAIVSGKKGNKFSLIAMLFIWLAICVLAYTVQLKWQFYGVAILVGIVMGGTQSLSRSTYSKLLPVNTDDTTSYFSFYDVLEKVAIVLGTFSFGIIEQLTGGIRNSVIGLTVFFILGIIFLLRVDIHHIRN